MTAEPTLLLAFLAGLASFLSPCVMPLIPSYITFITGMSYEEMVRAEDRGKVLKLTALNALAFILGFTVVFIALGASSSILGSYLEQYQDWLRIGGGVLIIFFGLFIAGAFKLDFMMVQKKFNMQNRPAGYVGTFLVGIAFAAGWTPCIGPILSAILIMASTQGSASYGTLLLAVYSLGLAVPFFISAVAFNSFIYYTRILNRHMRKIMIASGLILIIFGLLLLTNNLRYLTGVVPGLDFGI